MTVGTPKGTANLLLRLSLLLASAADAQVASTPGTVAADDDVAPPPAMDEAPAEPPAPPPVEELPPLPADMIVPQLSFSNPFNQYESGVIPGWQYGGEASLANDYISLTPAVPNKVGWAWSNEPVSMSAWEVQLEFHIGGQQSRGAGGGMAFWYTSQQGRTGPIYGHEDTYEGLGIFFDTYEGEDNEETEPFVVAMMNYGSAIGGDGDNPNYYDNQVGVCFAAYRNLPHLVRARIVWSHQKLQLWLDLDHSGHYQSCVQTKPGDERLKLPSSGYFGVTASTGSFGDSHVVYSLTLANLEGAADFEATPYHGADAAVPAEHVVHQEGRHHETHVKVATHPANLDTPTGTMAHAAEQAAHAAPVPPVQGEREYVSRLSHELRGVEAALYELKAHVRSGGDGAGTLPASLGQQLQELEKRLATQLSEALQRQPPADPAPLQKAAADAAAGCEATFAHSCAAPLSELQGAVEAIKSGSSGLATTLSSSSRAAESQGQRTDSRLSALDSKLQAAEARQLETAKALSAVQAQLGTALKSLEQLSTAGAGSQGWLMPLLVCGQMLALAAFLFYRLVAKDKKRDHLL